MHVQILSLGGATGEVCGSEIERDERGIARLVARFVEGGAVFETADTIFRDPVSNWVALRLQIPTRCLRMQIALALHIATPGLQVRLDQSV